MRWFPSSKSDSLSPDTGAEAMLVGVTVAILQTEELRVKETPFSTIAAVLPAAVWVEHVATVSVVGTGNKSTPFNKC